MTGQEILNETAIELELLYMLLVDRCCQNLRIQYINYRATGRVPDYMQGYAGIKIDN